MALNATLLASELKALADSVIANQGPKQNDEILLAFATAIVSHIQANATVTVAGGSSAGVYSVQ